MRIVPWSPHLHLFDRVAQEDCALFGYDFKRGEVVGCLLASANWDAQVFDAPKVFDPTRATNPHVSFGAGAHFCLGAALARLEMQIALRVLFARWPGLEVEGPRYADAWHFHGLERLAINRLA